jgi:hypothetical protein
VNRAAARAAAVKGSYPSQRRCSGFRGRGGVCSKRHRPLRRRMTTTPPLRGLRAREESE